MRACFRLIFLPASFTETNRGYLQLDKQITLTAYLLIFNQQVAILVTLYNESEAACKASRALSQANCKELVNPRRLSQQIFDTTPTYN